MAVTDSMPKVDWYLGRMPELSGVVAEALATGSKPFAGLSTLLVHHLTGEVLAVIAALRQLGCRDIVTVFVGYNADAEGAYLPDLQDLPLDEFPCYILDVVTGGGGSTKPVYHIARSFMRQPATDSTSILDALDATMKSKQLGFIEAMRGQEAGSEVLARRPAYETANATGMIGVGLVQKVLGGQVGRAAQRRHAIQLTVHDPSDERGDLGVLGHVPSKGAGLYQDTAREGRRASGGLADPA